MIRVFLSGTRKDLGSHFHAAIRAINGLPGFQAVAMEDISPEGIPGDKWSRREASKYDVHLGLLGWYYGNVSPGHRHSLTEQEYEAAQRAGIETLMFLTDYRDESIPAERYDADRPQMERFRNRVDAENTRVKVQCPDEFAAAAARAVQDWERRTLRGLTVAGDEYYRPFLSGDLLHGHQDTLVGQENALEAIRTFLGSSKKVLLLQGPWGTGKSRLLLEIARRIESLPIRFVREGRPFSRDALNLSAVDPCLVVLEDPHRYDEADLDFLFSVLVRYEVRLLIASRPTHAAALQERLLRAGFDVGQVEYLALDPLPDELMRRLVAGVLGQDGEAAALITQRTRGSALAAVLAARLFRRGDLTLGQMRDSAEFRQHIWTSYETALLRDLSEPRERHTDVLRLIALTSPVNTAEEGLMDTLASLLGWTCDQLHDEIALLEDAGLLLRRGRLVRIPVDAVSEAMLWKACVGAGGANSGFADRAIEALWDTCRKPIFRNLAVAAWDARQQGLEARPLDAAWRKAEAALRAGNWAVLEDLKEAAWAQPEAALDLAHNLMETPPEGVLSESSQHRLAELIAEGPLYHPRCVPDSCDLLWELARDSDPEARAPWTGQSAEKVLQEAGAWKNHRYLDHFEAFIDWCGRRLDVIPGHRMARYLQSVLGREVEHTWGDGNTFAVAPRPLNPDVVLPVRQRSLDLLEQIAKSSDPGAVAAAIKAIGEAATEVRGPLGQGVSEGTRKKWAAEEIDALKRLRAIRDYHGDPAADLCVLSEIWWQATHGPQDEVRGEAGRLMADLEASLAGSLALAFTPEWASQNMYEAEAMEKHRQAVAVIAREVAGRGSSPEVLLAEMHEVAERLVAYRREVTPGMFCRELTTANPRLGYEVTLLGLSRDLPVITCSIEQIVGGLLPSDPELARTLARTALASGSTQATYGLAKLSHRPEWVALVGEGGAEAELRVALSAPDRGVRRSALVTLGHSKALSDTLRLQILLAFDVEAFPDSIEDWATALVGSHLVEQCDDAGREIVAKALIAAPRIPYWSNRLLAYLSRTDAAKASDVIFGRLTHAKQKDEEYDRLPDHLPDDPFKDLDVQSRQSVLVGLGAYLGQKEPIVRYDAEKYFAQVSGGNRDVAARVVSAWVEAGDPDSLQVAARGLGKTGLEAIFQNEDLVVRLLRAADRHGAEAVQRVRSLLACGSLEGCWSRTPGQPAARDEELRDRARAAAGRYTTGSPERVFFEDLAETAERNIKRDLQDDEEEAIS